MEHLPAPGGVGDEQRRHPSLSKMIDDGLRRFTAAVIGVQVGWRVADELERVSGVAAQLNTGQLA